MMDYIHAIKLFCLFRNKTWAIFLGKIDFLIGELNLCPVKSSKEAIHMACFLYYLKSTLISYLDADTVLVSKTQSTFLMESLEKLYADFFSRNGFRYFFFEKIFLFILNLFF